MDAALRPESKIASKKFKWAALACLLIAAISRLSYLGDPFRNDAGIYIYFGKVVWEGGKLYEDFWDTKLPSVALLTAPLYAFFGNHWWPYVIVQAALGIGAAWLLAQAVGKYVGKWAFAPALLFGLIGLNLSRITITGFQLETIQIFFEILAACLVLRSLTKPGLTQVFLVGFVVGIAAMPKPTGLAVGGAAAWAYLWESRRSGLKRSILRILVMAIGALIPASLVVAWVAGQSWRGEMPFLLQEIRLYGSGTPWRRILQLRAWVFLILPFAPLLIRWFWIHLQRSADEFLESPPHQAIKSFAIAWCAAEIAGVILQKRLYSYHFLIIMPPAVLLFAISRRTSLTAILFSIAPLAILSMIYSVPGYLMLRHPGAMPVSRYIIAHTQPHDAVWADPEARLLLETGRMPGSRLQMTFYLVNHDDAPARFTRILLRDFQERKPKYIVLQQEWSQEVRDVAQETVWLVWLPQRRRAYLQACAQIEAYIKSHYQFEKTIDGQSVYRRRQ